MLPRLIINADDFGLTPGVNRAIAELHRAGAITSTTLMANGGAFEDAAEIARQMPHLAVGCHIVLIRGSPVAPSYAVRSLLIDGKSFRDSLPRFLFDLQRRRISEAEIEVEATAQIRQLQMAGIAVSHVDTHKHPHLFPRVARPLMRAATACGVMAIRNPFEPQWSASLSRRLPTRIAERALLRGFRHVFEALCKTYGLRTNDGCIGVSSMATLDQPTLRKIIHRLPAGTFELICHPGYCDADLSATRSRFQESRDRERQVLEQIIPAAVTEQRFELVNFRNVQLGVDA